MVVLLSSPMCQSSHESGESFSVHRDECRLVEVADGLGSCFLLIYTPFPLKVLEQQGAPRSSVFCYMLKTSEFEMKRISAFVS